MVQIRYRSFCNILSSDDVCISHIHLLLLICCGRYLYLIAPGACEAAAATLLTCNRQWERLENMSAGKLSKECFVFLHWLLTTSRWRRWAVDAGEEDGNSPPAPTDTLWVGCGSRHGARRQIDGQQRRGTRADVEEASEWVESAVWADGGPATAWGSIRSGAAPCGRVRGRDEACSSTERTSCEGEHRNIVWPDQPLQLQPSTTTRSKGPYSQVLK